MSENLKNNNVFKKITYEKVITIAFLIVLAITLILNIIFQGGSKVGRIILIAGTVIAFWIFF